MLLGKFAENGQKDKQSMHVVTLFSSLKERTLKNEDF